MKNSKNLIIMGGLLVTAALTACQGTGTKSTAGSVASAAASSEAESTDIFVQLVPSNNATTLLSNATKLEPYLTKYVDKKYTFHVSVGTSYGAVNTAVENGKLDAGFLTASGYAQASIEHPGKVEVLLQALRAGYKVQADDFKGDLYDTALREKQRKAMNGEIALDGTAITSANTSSAYVYKGDQSMSSVSFYSGIVISRRDSYGSTLTGAKTFDTNHDGTITIQELHDGKAKFGIMGSTSGSGYIYPTYMLYNMGFTKGFVTADQYDALSTEDQAKALIGVPETDTSKGYPGMVSDLMNGTIDAGCGFMDIRYGSAYVQKTSTFYQDDTLFTKSYTVAITDPVVNDTVCCYSGISDGKKEAIKTAFKAAAADGTTSDVTTPAGMLYQIYSHTGYNDAKDSDFDPVRTMYKWQAEHNLL
jgi:ABC-type phosphate/phosphonate transport system substrate-binding protein